MNPDAKIPSELQESHAQVVEIFQNPDPFLDAVLRGHLIVEERLGDLAAAYAFNPDHITNLRLTFHEKLQLARAFDAKHADQPIWAAIAALNSLRNDVAHHLTSDQRNQRYQQFLRFVSDDLPKEAALPAHRRVGLQSKSWGSISYIVGGLTSMPGEYRRRAQNLHLMTRAKDRIFEEIRADRSNESNGPTTK